MEKELTIIPPIGYEIDKQKSTFDKIVFKKIAENPKTWEDYCKKVNGISSFYINTENKVYIDHFSGLYNEFATKKTIRAIYGTWETPATS